MNPGPEEHDKANGHRVRPSLWISIGIVVLLCAAAALFLQLRQNSQTGVPVGTANLSAAPSEKVEQPALSQSMEKPAENQVVSSPAATTTAPTMSAAEPTPETRQLVEALLKLEPPDGVLTEELAATWKQNLQRLIQQGTVAIPAIQEFLARNVDVVFGDAGKQMLGYSSARMVMFDALSQIGGSDAVSAMVRVLQTTAEPMEIATLAQDLEKLEPQQHQVEALNAARQALEIASSRRLEPVDVAPLFEVLQKYGNGAALTDLQKAAGQWNYYGAIALAQLPDGAGIPSLIQIAQDAKAATPMRDAAFLTLAQVSDQSAGARAALVEQARLNGISDFAWRILTPVLGGDQVGFVNSVFDYPLGLPQVGGLRTTGTSDNQSFYTMPGTLTQDQLTQRLALIDELLSVTSNPIGKEQLEQLKTTLSRRAAATVASGP